MSQLDGLSRHSLQDAVASVLNYAHAHGKHIAIEQLFDLKKRQRPDFSGLEVEDWIQLEEAVRGQMTLLDHKTLRLLAEKISPGLHSVIQKTGRSRKRRVTKYLDLTNLDSKIEPLVSPEVLEIYGATFIAVSVSLVTLMHLGQENSASSNALQFTLADIETINGKLEARDYAANIASGTAEELFDIQIDECMEFLVATREMNSGEAKTLSGHIEAYSAALSARKFLRADAKFRTFDRENVKKELFEIELAQLETISENHFALRGVCPEYQEYVEAFNKGREGIISRKPVLLSEVLVPTEAIGASYRKLLVDIESQLESEKVSWDSIGIAEKTRLIVEKARGFGIDIKLADDVIQVLDKWLSG